MANLFTPENVMPYRFNTAATTNVGEWQVRNGENAMALAPSPYYNGEYSFILHNEFLPNKQYVFDLWMDADNVIYQDVNRAGGITVRYTDGTQYSITVTGTHGSGGTTGFVHKKYVTTASKSVSGFSVYYYVSIPVFYRWDSSITEYTNTSVEKTGVLDTGILKENSDIASTVNGGEITCDRILET